MAVQGGQAGQEAPFKPVFSQEELRVLRECNRESFYFRSIPFATALATATFLALRKGLLRASARFGYAPKLVGATAVGYFVGKVSYQGTCAEKIMQLPNSTLAEALRRRKGRMGLQETLGMEPGFSLSPADDVTAQAEPALESSLQADNSDTLEEYHRGVTDTLSPYTATATATAQPQTTYHELRRQNREEYTSKMAEKYKRPLAADGPQEIYPPLPPSPPPPPPPSSFSSSSFSSPSSLRKNKYGDDVYE